jgi:uncharacterized protein
MDIIRGTTMYKVLFLTLVILVPTTVKSANIFVSDRQFTEKNYTQAIQGYKLAAKVGNPHAYYQLGNMYYQGLGTQQDIVNALINFSLAAEQDFHNAQKLMDKLVNALSPESKMQVTNILAEHLALHGQESINKKYFPIINHENLTTKFTFDGSVELQTVFYPEDIDMDDYNGDEGASGFYDAEEDEITGEDSLTLLISSPRAPFLIIDHDIHSDGSVRYTNEVQKFGLYLQLLNSFTLFGNAKPEFNGMPSHFSTRSYLGAASYNRFTLLRENEAIYGTILKLVRRFKKSSSIEDEFNLAMLMLNFPWIEQEDLEAESKLLKLAKQGHSPAMFEYGFKLYREQREIPQAIKWIAEASKYGLVRAEYRLATLLQNSPWVVPDEQKALFWYQSAMRKNDMSAAIRATEILLTASDESLRDMDLAIEYLNNMEDSQDNNPEFHYLKALTYRTGQQRDISLTVRHLKRAIMKAQMANWDTTDWDDLLSRIVTGNVYVTDEN